MKTAFGITLAVLVLAAGFALFSDPISVAYAGKPVTTPVTCTLSGSYYIDATGPTDVLSPSVSASGDCDTLNCQFTISSRIGDIGDFFAICTAPATPCDAYTTLSVDVSVDSFPYTDEPEVISFCSANPYADWSCLTGSATKCPFKEVDCFTSTDPACSASKKLGGGIKGTFACVLNLPEPPADVVPNTVYVTAHCTMS